MKRQGCSLTANWRVKRLWTGAFCLWLAVVPVKAAQQAGTDVAPHATPQIRQIEPRQGIPGSHLTLIIQGSNFSGGAYVSSVSTAVHIDAPKRVSAIELDAPISISPTAQPGTVTSSVSNPASGAAEATFEIVPGQAAPPESAEPPKAAALEPPPAPLAPPAAPAQEVNPPAPAAPPAPTAPAAPAAPSAPASPTAPAASPAPEVTSIEPARVRPGFDVDLKVTGKNFGQRAKVSFANPGIRVVDVIANSGTQLTVHIKVAFDAAAGVASMFVINPDDQEAESPFEVVAKGVAKPIPPRSPATPVATPVAAGIGEIQRFDAFHLGNPAEIFQMHGKVKGSLLVTEGTIRYVEDGKTLVNIPVNEVKEIKVSSYATATFHITVASGKTYHFAPGSLKPSDARSIVEALRKALPPPSM